MIGQWSSKCALCNGSRISPGSSVGLGHEVECPWCRSVRLKYGDYFYPITAQNAHLFKQAERVHHMTASELAKVRQDAYEAGARSAVYFGA